MANLILGKLLPLTLVLTLALAMALLLRRPLRGWLGASQAYLLWGLVPLALCSALLPTPQDSHILLQFAPAAPVMQPLHTLQTQITAGPGQQVQQALLMLWLGGALLALLWFALQHRRFLLALGRLDKRGGLHYAEFDDIGPALLGLWRPKVVVPVDFDSRYGAAEQALVLAHEQVHVERADVLANLLCAALQCLFWFHPLVHLAARCFRFDQELACDAAVLQRHPESRRTYAEAMLKTHLGGFGTPIACPWLSSHPLKERIMQLNARTPRPLQRLAGATLIAGLMLAGTWSAWAAQAPAAGTANDTYRLKLNISNSLGADKRIEIDSPALVTEDGNSFPVFLLKDGQSATVAESEGDTRLSYRVTLKHINGATDNNVEMQMEISKGGHVFTDPSVIALLDQPGKMRASFGGNGGLDYEIDYSISRAAPQK